MRNIFFSIEKKERESKRGIFCFEKRDHWIYLTQINISPMSLYDLALLSSLQNSRSKGNFSEFMERETGYTWDGTSEGKIALLEHFDNTFTSDSDQ